MSDCSLQKLQNEYTSKVDELIALNYLILEKSKQFFSKVLATKSQYFQLKKMILKNNILSFESEVEEMKNLDYELFFKNLNNIFNDNLPTNKYFDLSNAIEKLYLLNPFNEKVNAIVFDWKKQLEKILEYLLNLQTNLKAKLVNTLLIQDGLQISDLASKYSLINFKESKFLSDLQFDLKICDETREEANWIIQTINTNFEML